MQKSVKPQRPKLLQPATVDAAGGAAALQEWLNVKVPAQRGLKKQMVGMACQNSRVALDEKFRLIERDEERTSGAALSLGQSLGLESLSRIEAFDNSNIQGTNPVSAMVVFIDGKPARKEYRKYKVRTVQGPDDYETMREVIRRRYERVLKEDLPQPDLIVVDGGKGQISSAIDILQNELGLYIPVCGLVKDDKHKTAQLLIGDSAGRCRWRGTARNSICCSVSRMKSTASRSPSTASNAASRWSPRSWTPFRASGISGGSCC